MTDDYDVGRTGGNEYDYDDAHGEGQGASGGAAREELERTSLVSLVVASALPTPSRATSNSQLTSSGSVRLKQQQLEQLELEEEQQLALYEQYLFSLAPYSFQQVSLPPKHWISAI